MGEAENQAEPEYEITKGIQYKAVLSAFIILFYRKDPVTLTRESVFL